MEALLDEVIRHLTTWKRPSASDGERRAAEWIAGKLEAEGCAATVEEEPAHGTYWWPLGLLTGHRRDRRPDAQPRRHARCGRRDGRRGVIDDISGGQPLVSPPLPSHALDARTSSPSAATGRRTHTRLRRPPRRGALVAALPPRRAPRSPSASPPADKTDTTPRDVPGARRPGARRARRTHRQRAPATRRRRGSPLGSALTFAEIGSRDTVDGANDNLSGGRRTRRPRTPARARSRCTGCACLLVSTGGRGVVHGGHARLRPAPLPAAAARAHDLRLPRHGRLAAPHRSARARA